MKKTIFLFSLVIITIGVYAQNTTTSQRKIITTGVSVAGLQTSKTTQIYKDHAGKTNVTTSTGKGYGANIGVGVAGVSGSVTRDVNSGCKTISTSASVASYQASRTTEKCTNSAGKVTSTTCVGTGRGGDVGLGVFGATGSVTNNICTTKTSK